MKRFILIFVLIATIGCKNQSEPAKEVSDDTVEAVEDTAKPSMMVLDLIASAKADQIQQDYPDARPATETRMMEEGTVEMIEETLYPDSKRQITLYYDSKEGKKGDLDQIWLMQEDSPWELASGLTVGMRLDKLNELNAKPVAFYGFEWDGSGFVDFQGGKLADENTSVFLYPSIEVPQDTYEKFMGSEIFDSQATGVDELQLKISHIIYTVK
ncbi:MAG: hypothetical protein CL868_19105 [Cytophagaceae bacterium]|nr:hypothetical protein [Cytophagaceae bacterium]|tara:strand:+ start:4190 stop:4828 length:639 start_codon:yes stop_codon:yes gene_type:complete